MRTLSQQQKQALWDEVCREFPRDRVMQEVHYARLLHLEMLRDATPAEEIAFYREAAAEVKEELGARDPEATTP